MEFIVQTKNRFRKRLASFSVRFVCQGLRKSESSQFVVIVCVAGSEKEVSTQ